MTFSSRPDFYFGIAFNADPNDPIQVPAWVEYTDQVRSISAMARGKQYELSQVMSATPEIVVRDPDEALNPDNTAGPNYPNVIPYRETVLLGQWPNYGGTAPAGNANLLNLNTWQNPIDPSFESYAVGTLPPWITEGDVAAAISTTTPHAGAKCLRWTEPAVGATGGRHPSWPGTFIPGRQYTASAWFRQSATDSWSLGVSGLNTAFDLFNRTSAASWGVADAGGAWSNSGGSAADFSVTPEFGLHAQNTAFTARFSQLNVSAADANVACYVSPVFSNTNQIVRSGVSARLTSNGSDGYSATIELSQGGTTANVVLLRRASFVETNIGSVALPIVYDPDFRVGVRLVTTGERLEVYAWREDQPEPAQPVLTVIDAVLTAASGVGVYSQLVAGSTAPAAVAEFSDFCATGSAISASVTTSGAYTRLSTTFVATQPNHPVYLRANGSITAANAVCLDDLQNEQGPAATANSTTGPTISPIFRNFAERFTRTYDETGFEGMATIPCVDALAALSTIVIPAEYQAALDSTFPLYSWPLSDSGGGTNFAEVIQGGPLTQLGIHYTGATTTGVLTPGAAFSLPGYPGQSGAQIAGNVSTGGGISMVATHLTIPNDGPNTFALTLAYWLTTSDPADNVGDVALFNKNGNIMGVRRRYNAGDHAPWPQVFYSPLGSGAQGPPATQTYVDGLPHFYVMTAAFVGNNFSQTLYVDNVLVSSSTTPIVTAFGTSAPLFRFDSIQLAGGFQGGVYGDGTNGTYAQVHVWGRALSLAEITTLYNAGQGYAGELTGARIARHLTMGSYNGPVRLDPGTQPMGPPSYTPSIDLNTDSQNTTSAENGDFWVGPDGAVVFADSNARYLALTSIATLGENAASGEAPYESGVTFDDDPTYIYANVQVGRPNGINAVGGSPGDIQAATRRFFGRTLAITVDVETDDQAQGLANWTFYTHNRPSTRVAKVTLTPSANPALWPFVLGLEVGNRITVTKRSKAANGGTGITVSRDYFIEQVTNDGIDFDLSTWTTTYVVSPVGSATSGNGLTVQPWILGNATLGVLGSTTIPGY